MCVTVTFWRDPAVIRLTQVKDKLKTRSIQANISFVSFQNWSQKKKRLFVLRHSKNKEIPRL